MTGKRADQAECLGLDDPPFQFFAFFAVKSSALPVRNARSRITSTASVHRLAGRSVGTCALYGHFCKIDRIGASSRRLLHVIATYSFI